MKEEDAKNQMKPASTDSEDSDDELDIELKRFSAINLFRFKKIFFIYTAFIFRSTSSCSFFKCARMHMLILKKRETARSLFIFTFKRASLKKYIQKVMYFTCNCIFY